VWLLRACGCLFRVWLFGCCVCGCCARVVVRVLLHFLYEQFHRLAVRVSDNIRVIGDHKEAGKEVRVCR
jgi:hypothetical protein